MKHVTGLTAGDICWLPTEELISPDDLTRLQISGVDFGILGHPVVILSLQDDGKSAIAQILTTFGGKSLADYCIGDRPVALDQRLFFPIHPAPQHPVTGKTLFCAENTRLDRPSYVRLQARHELPVSALLALRNPCRLTAESLEQLRQFVPPPTTTSTSPRMGPWGTKRHRSPSPPFSSPPASPSRAEGRCVPQPPPKKRQLNQSWRRTNSPSPSPPPSPSPTVSSPACVTGSSGSTVQRSLAPQTPWASYASAVRCGTKVNISNDSNTNTTAGTAGSRKRLAATTCR